MDTSILYKEGLHLISEFSVKDPVLLGDYHTTKMYLSKAIQDSGLVKIDEIYHQFPGSGFTGVICLTESHISIHTWPEFNRVTFDVFLSNYMKYNDDIAERIHQGLLDLLGAETTNVTRLKR